MDLSNLNVEGEWLEVEIIEPKEFAGTVKLLIVPRPYSSAMKMILHDDMDLLLANLVVDWNLWKDGKKIEPTKVNKLAYFATMHGWKLKEYKYTNEDVKPKNFGTEIIAFAQDIKNFTKNLKPTLN